MTALSRYAHYSPGEHGLPHMGEVIADHRKRKGHSQKKFAIICGVEKQTVVYWEQQKYLADMKRRIFLCKTLSIPPAYLGLTWRSVIADDQAATSRYLHDVEQIAQRLQDNAYGLYEDILTLAHTGPNQLLPAATYKFFQHQHELEELVKQAPELEKESWIDLLCRYYQRAATISVGHNQNEQALSYINRAVDMALSAEPEDAELVGSALYRRSRIHVIHSHYDVAKQDIQAALEKAERARGPLKGNTYLRAAEIKAMLTGNEEKTKTQCRQWQNQAANLLYKNKFEEDETFLWFNLYGVHHERAKTLARFSLFHTSDNELVELLKDPYAKANHYLKDAQDALELAKTHMMDHEVNMDYALTQARVYLIGKEFEESARQAKSALRLARAAHSQRGIEQVRAIFNMLNTLAPENPHVLNLGIELGIF